MIDERIEDLLAIIDCLKRERDRLQREQEVLRTYCKSIETQLEICREYCRKKEHEIVGEYQDRALSGVARSAETPYAMGAS